MAATTDTHHDDHPRDSFYFKVAGGLALLTAIEVVLSYVGLNTSGLILTLFPLMIAKFAIVAALFMHLKGDNKLFTQLFVTGIILAVFVYGIVLFAFDEFF